MGERSWRSEPENRRTAFAAGCGSSGTGPVRVAARYPFAGYDLRDFSGGGGASRRPGHCAGIAEHCGLPGIGACVHRSRQPALHLGMGAARGEPGLCALAGGAGSRRVAGIRRNPVRAGLRIGDLQLAVSRQNQEPSPALVRHENLRQPGQSAQILSAAKSRINLPVRPPNSDRQEERRCSRLWGSARRRQSGFVRS